MEVNLARELIKANEIEFANGSRKAIISIDFIERMMHEYHELKVKKLNIDDVMCTCKTETEEYFDLEADEFKCTKCNKTF